MCPNITHTRAGGGKLIRILYLRKEQIVLQSHTNQSLKCKHPLLKYSWGKVLNNTCLQKILERVGDRREREKDDRGGGGGAGEERGVYRLTRRASCLSDVFLGTDPWSTLSSIAHWTRVAKGRAYYKLSIGSSTWHSNKCFIYSNAKSTIYFLTFPFKTKHKHTEKQWIPRAVEQFPKPSPLDTVYRNSKQTV